MAVVHLGALGLLVMFHREPLLPMALPLVRLLGGEAATHYPTLYYALPVMFSRLMLVVPVLVDSVAMGAATLLFARAFGFESPGNVWGRTLRAAPVLMILTAFVALLVFGLSELARIIPSDSRLLRWGTRGGLLLVFVVIEVLMVYARAWVMLAGHSVLPAIRDSIRVTVRTLLPTLIVVGIPAFLLFPLGYISGRTDLFATKLRPEVVTALLTTRVAFDLLFGFLILGCITRLFLWRMEAQR